MNHEDVEQTLNLAVVATGVKQIQVEHRPRLLSDNGSAYISQEFAEYMIHLTGIRGVYEQSQNAPYSRTGQTSANTRQD
jgi:hypothetical protein